MAITEAEFERKTKAQAAYRKWYKKNKDIHNRKRTEQYASDSTLRQRIKTYQEAYREERKKKGIKPPTKISKHYRKIGNTKVEVFRIGKVVEMVGRDVQTLRNWEKFGYVPASLFHNGTNKHRYYTENQIRLLMEFGELMDEVRYQPAIRESARIAKTEELFANWNK